MISACGHQKSFRAAPACRDQAESARGAISSAVEHLPYKEIVTGSIPVSPICHDQASQRNTTRHMVAFPLLSSSGDHLRYKLGFLVPPNGVMPNEVRPQLVRRSSCISDCRTRVRRSSADRWLKIETGIASLEDPTAWQDVQLALRFLSVVAPVLPTSE